MIIIEGPDGVGKTTLCRRLLKHLPTHVYAHFSRLPNEFDFYWGYLERASQNIVQDRFHMSEIAYAIMRGDKTPLDLETYRLVDARLRLLGSFTVLVTADPDLVYSRWDPSQMYDRDRTTTVARVFLDIESLPGYQMDVDYRFHCTKDVPYVPDLAVDGILTAYQRRLDNLRAVALRKPTTL